MRSLSLPLRHACYVRFVKKIALFITSLLFLTGCAQTTIEKIYDDVVPVNFYFVSDTPRGFKLFSETQNFLVKEGGSNLQIISDLVSGKVFPSDPEYVNLWGGTSSVNSVSIADSVATVDLGSLTLNIGAEAEQRAIDQIVWTLTEFNSDINSIAFTVNSKTDESFAGHVDATMKFVRATDYEVLNPIQISLIEFDTEVASSITISGQACTFEANVIWRLSRDGVVVKKGVTTATSGCPDRGDWRISFLDLEPGNYTIAALEYSAEGGSLFALDDKKFSVEEL